MNTSRIPALWWGWLVAAFALTALTALGWILYPALAQRQLAAALLGSADALAGTSDGIRRLFSWLNSFSAVVVLAWMVSLMCIVLGPFRRGERWAWQTISGSVAIWFIVDTARSIEMGFSQNAMLNVVWLILYAVPLIATYRRFHRSETTMLRERDAAV